MIKYDLHNTRDCSYSSRLSGRIIRFVYDVVVEERPTREDLFEITRDIIDNLKHEDAKFHAANVLFWSSKQEDKGEIGKSPSLASVTYAPQGLWENAATAVPGEFGGFLYRIEYNRFCEKCNNI